MELGGKEGLFVRGQSRGTWSIGTVCARLAVLTAFRGHFGAKKAVLGHKMRSFGRELPDSAPPPRGASGDFLAQKWEFGKGTP